MMPAKLATPGLLERKEFLTDRKFKSCLGYPCENYLPIADRPEKTIHKQEITDFFSK